MGVCVCPFNPDFSESSGSGSLMVWIILEQSCAESIGPEFGACFTVLRHIRNHGGNDADDGIDLVLELVNLYPVLKSR